MYPIETANYVQLPGLFDDEDDDNLSQDVSHKHHVI